MTIPSLELNRLQESQPRNLQQNTSTKRTSQDPSAYTQNFELEESKDSVIRRTKLNAVLSEHLVR
jgi:hypothetical protein